MRILRFMAFALGGVAALLGARAMLNSRRVLGTLCWLPFVLVVVMFLLGALGLAYSLFPYVVMDRLTIWQAASATQSLAVIAFGLIATGIAVLVGPVFIPFFLVPQMEWMFWGWLKSLLQYAFYQVIAQAFVFVGGTFLMNFLDAFPPPYTVDRILSLIHI